MNKKSNITYSALDDLSIALPRLKGYLRTSSPCPMTGFISPNQNTSKDSGSTFPVQDTFGLQWSSISMLSTSRCPPYTVPRHVQRRRPSPSPLPRLRHQPTFFLVLALSLLLPYCFCQTHVAFTSTTAPAGSQNSQWSSVENLSYMATPTNFHLYAYANASGAGANSLIIYDKAINRLGTVDKLYTATRGILMTSFMDLYVTELATDGRLGKFTLTENTGPTVAITFQAHYAAPITFPGYLAICTIPASNYVFATGHNGIVNRFDRSASTLTNITGLGAYPLRAVNYWGGSLLLLSERLRIVSQASPNVVVKELRDTDYASRMLLVDRIPQYNGRVYVDCSVTQVCIWDVINDANLVTYAIKPRYSTGSNNSGMINAGNLDFIIIAFPGNVALRFLNKSTWTMVMSWFHSIQGTIGGNTLIEGHWDPVDSRSYFSMAGNESPFVTLAHYLTGTALPGGCTGASYLSGGSCIPCPTYCLTCTSGTECLTCQPGYGLHGTCRACLGTEFLNVTVCALCTSPCLSCSGSTTCSSCISGRYLKGSSCSFCHLSCLTCNGGTSSACLSCNTGFSLLSSSCFPITCNPGTFLSLSSCLPCDQSCLTCSISPSNCLTCSSGKYLSSNTCQSCNLSCLTCSGPSATDCLSCSPGFQISGGACIQSFCSSNKFMNNGQCTPCHSSCLTCSGGSSVDCTTCGLGSFVSGGSCSPILCPAGQYLSGNDCLNCHAYCSTCQGPSSIDCLSCPLGFNLKLNGFCERQCLTNEYNNNADNLCYLCDAACVTCNKGGRFGCKSCQLTETLRFDGLCVKTCFSGFYYLDTNNECYQCHPTCKECSGPGEAACTQCKNGLLVQLDRTCQTGCPIGTAIVNSIRCEKCHASCKSCTDTTDQGCLECLDGLFKLPSKKCDSAIPRYHFFDTTDRTVKACHSECEKCDGVNEDNCLSCRDFENYTLSQNKRCINCYENYLENPETCSFIVSLKLEQPSVSNINPKASETLKLTFDKDSYYSGFLTLTRFREVIKIEIDELSPQDYTVTLERRGGEYLIDVSATKSQVAPVSLTVTPTKKKILTDVNTGAVILVFLPNKAIKQIQLREAPSAAVMESLGNLSESSESTVGAISTAAAAFSALSILATSPLMTPLIKFLKIFKLISRLKLINVFFGAYLEIVLDLAGKMFAIGNDPQDFKFKQFDMTTRGKLTRFKITTISVEMVWLKYMIYYLILLLRLYQAILRKYVTRRQNFSQDDQIVDKIADESRIIIFTMVVIDITFYSMHCITHMNMSIKQSRDSITSFILSCITLLAVSVDIVLLFLSNKSMNVQKILNERKKIEIMENNDRIRKKRLENLKATANEPESEPEKQKSENEMKEDERGESPNNEHEHQNEEQRQEQEKKKEKKEKKGVKKRVQPSTENSSQAAVKFFTEGIISEHIKTARFFNSISLAKLIIVEPFYVTLQLFPTFQILTLLGIQIAYFAYFCKMAFFKRVFSSKYNMVQILVNELAILLFLVIGAVFQVAGGAHRMGVGVSNSLQIVGIVMLGISCILGAAIMVGSIIMTLVSLVKKRIAKKRYEEYRRAFQIPSISELPKEDDKNQEQQNPHPDFESEEVDVPAPLIQDLEKKRKRNLIIRNRDKLLLAQRAGVPTQDAKRSGKKLAEKTKTSKEPEKAVQGSNDENPYLGNQSPTKKPKRNRVIMNRDRAFQINNL